MEQARVNGLVDSKNVAVRLQQQRLSRQPPACQPSQIIAEFARRGGHQQRTVAAEPRRASQARRARPVALGGRPHGHRSVSGPRRPERPDNVQHNSVIAPVRAVAVFVPAGFPAVEFDVAAQQLSGLGGENRLPDVGAGTHAGHAPKHHLQLRAVGAGDLPRRGAEPPRDKLGLAAHRSGAALHDGKWSRRGALDRRPLR